MAIKKKLEIALGLYGALWCMYLFGDYLPAKLAAVIVPVGGALVLLVSFGSVAYFALVAIRADLKNLKRKTWHDNTRCVFCGYPRSGLTGDTCPECGEVFDLETHRSKTHCTHCGYPREGIASDKCPECGEKYESPPSRQSKTS